MTEVLYNPKIKPEHLARKAIVYLRQSSEKQVRQNKESQLLQYAVADRVRALGWKQVEIINSDLGSSAGLASAQREGFERILSMVALGEVGIVGSREVSRLSRTDKDWCRLLEVCRTSATHRCRRARSTALVTRRFCITARRATARVHEATRRLRKPCSTPCNGCAPRRS